MGNKISLAQRRRARQLIMQALYQWIISRMDPIDITLQFHEDNPGKIDWQYFDKIFPDIPKRSEFLNSTLVPHLDRDIGSLDPVETALLYLGAYELASRIDVPYRVVINECVELAKSYGATDSHKYINAVLDKLVPSLRAAEFAAKS